MTNLLHYQIRIPIASFELEELARMFISEIQDLLDTMPAHFIEISGRDIIIFQSIFSKAMNKLEMDTRRSKMERYKREKPYMVKLTKIQILWLHTYIAGVPELSSLRTNILEPHIIDIL